MRTNLKNRVAKLETRLAVDQRELLWVLDEKDIPQQLPSNSILVTFSPHIPKPAFVEEDQPVFIPEEQSEAVIPQARIVEGDQTV